MNSKSGWSPSVIGRPHRHIRCKPPVNPDPCAVIVDFRPVIWTFTPDTSPFSNLFDDDQYRNKSQLRDFLTHFTIQDIISAILLSERSDDASPNLIWDMIEGRGLVDHPVMSDMTDLEALSFIIDLVQEHTVIELDRRFESVNKELMQPINANAYYFDHWLAPTVAVLTTIQFNTASS